MPKSNQKKRDSFIHSSILHTPAGLTSRHALVREAEDRVVRQDERSPLRWALHTLGLALHEQCFSPGRSCGAWPTVALLSIAPLQARRRHADLRLLAGLRQSLPAPC